MPLEPPHTTSCGHLQAAAIGDTTHLCNRPNMSSRGLPYIIRSCHIARAMPCVCKHNLDTSTVLSKTAACGTPQQLTTSNTQQCDPASVSNCTITASGRAVGPFCSYQRACVAGVLSLSCLPRLQTSSLSRGQCESQGGCSIRCQATFLHPPGSSPLAAAAASHPTAAQPHHSCPSPAHAPAWDGY